MFYMYLDEAALGTPSVALACAAREVLHIGEIVETMLRQSMTALQTDDRRLVAEICRMDNAVDKLDEAVKIYITRLTRQSPDDQDGQRAMEIVSFSINLERRIARLGALGEEARQERRDATQRQH